ncbi:MAG TPA: NAD(P)/FAD-dependent oxidoreductase [Candidatus Paceibacterota bacterium]
MKSETIWDVAVIGGGPAGMMAAGRSAERGHKVVLIEKNATLGKKLLISGGGRCNLTNAEADAKKFLAKFKTGGKFFASPLSRFDTASAVKFFNDRGMPTKVEALQRVFPLSNSAKSVWDVLVNYLAQGGVTVISNAPVTHIDAKDGRIESIQLKSGRVVRARSYIFATGGVSHPETGSTGDGFKWLKSLGHTVKDTDVALVPIALKASPLSRAAGVSLQAKITTFQKDVKHDSQIGKILITHVGLSGPAILNMSRDIGELLTYGEVMLELDLLPSEGYEKVDARLQSILKEHASKKIRNALREIVPPALVPVILESAHIGEVECNKVTRKERVALMKTLKHLRVEVKGLLGLDKAVTTSGGVSLTEIDFKTMRSLRYLNLYIIGDLLDINRPSGGYSLQLCWTTGFVAGSAVT